jgi:hypothetical protein
MVSENVSHEAVRSAHSEPLQPQVGVHRPPGESLSPALTMGLTSEMAMLRQTGS